MIGEQIKQRRKQEKMTQQALAKLLHTTASTISKWENNKSVPNKKTIKQLQKLWNISLDEPQEKCQNTKEETQCLNESQSIAGQNTSNNDTNSIQEQQNTAMLEKTIDKNKQLMISGIVDFEEIITKNVYYIDKTSFISDLVSYGGKVNLITRPRRFGKTLTMSMLKYFFDIKGDKGIFNGLQIAKDVEFCKKYMGQYPVISITLGSVISSKKANVDITESFEIARSKFLSLVINIASEYDFLLSSEKLTPKDKEDYEKLLSESMTNTVLTSSFNTLSRLLYKHYGKKSIILIDEYDVPLQEAYTKGYYQEMLALIRDFYGSTFKYVDYLELGVITGCLRVSKENIFTGFNNPEVFTVLSDRFNTALGFTEEEVRSMMKYYQIEEYYTLLKDWYEGYKFAGVDIFCPWDTLLYCKQLYIDHNEIPELYWINMSHNQIVYDLIEQYSDLAKEDIETLLSGGTIEKYINQYLNYDDINQAKNSREKALTSLWSMLLMTGYLTATHTSNKKIFALKIPNYEIREIYQISFANYMEEQSSTIFETMKRINKGIEEQNAGDTAQYIHEFLKVTYPLQAELHKGEREADYQNLLTPVFNTYSWILKREQESGSGRCDFSIRIPLSRIAILMEFKHSQKGDEKSFNNACKEALTQIQDKNYAEYFENNYPNYNIIHCGIAFHHKDCKVIFTNAKNELITESGISGRKISKSASMQKSTVTQTTFNIEKEQSEQKSTSGRKKERKSTNIRVTKEQQKIIKNLTNKGMTAKDIAESLELPENIVEKYMK